MASYESLTDFPTINEERADVLRSVGIATPRDVATVPLEELVDIDGLPRPLAERIHDTATEEFGDLTPEFDESIEEPYQFYLADPDPENTEPVDYSILIGPEFNARAEHDWAVYRSREDGVHIPAGTQLYVFNHGDIVIINGDQFCLHIAQLLVRDIDESEWPGQVVEFPKILQARTYDSPDAMSDDVLKTLLLSVTGDELIDAQ